MTAVVLPAAIRDEVTKASLQLRSAEDTATGLLKLGGSVASQRTIITTLRAAYVTYQDRIAAVDLSAAPTAAGTRSALQPPITKVLATLDAAIAASTVEGISTAMSTYPAQQAGVRAVRDALLAATGG